MFAVGLPISARLGWTHPEIAGFLIDARLGRPRALRDIQADRTTGRFTVPNAEIALSAAVGGLLRLLRVCQCHPERVQENHRRPTR
jgi:hypothetical protein